MGPELDSTDALVRDTYVQFAVAMFRAQNLETEIVNAMSIARLPDLNVVVYERGTTNRDLNSGVRSPKGRRPRDVTNSNLKNWRRGAAKYRITRPESGSGGEENGC